MNHAATVAVNKERQKRVTNELLKRYGKTFTEEACIQFRDTPVPLFQLLVMAILFSAPIQADKAMQAVKAVFERGWDSPRKMDRSSWDQRTSFLNAHGYARYDESAARKLGQSTHLLNTRYEGDLRNLREAAEHDVKKELELLQEFKGLGETGSQIFLREAQAVWPEAYPFIDDRARKSAESLGLPKSANTLSELAGGPKTLTRLVAALVRVDLAGDDARQEIKAASA